MQYVGIQTQQSRNNLRSGILLFLFPCLVAVLTYLFSYLLITFTVTDDYGQYDTLAMTNQMFINLIPYIIGGVLVWFIIAYFANSSIIKAATGARPLERKENKRIYNLVENLCMSQGMKMPKINIIDDNSLNAYASGINERTYTVTLSKGIIEKLNDEELEGVIAHELTHIRNHDVRLLIISIVFVGIFSMLAQIALRSVYYSSWTRSRNDKNNGAILILVLATLPIVTMIVAAIGYFFATLMRFAISRKREYMADAGAAEMTKNPLALASALRKISADPDIEAVEREDVAQLFIQHPGKQAKSALSGLSGLFATHPPIEKRIAILEQF
jgi:heat shock protein HtpX